MFYNKEQEIIDRHIGKEIKQIKMVQNENGININFADGDELSFSMEYACCENRYMTTSDDLDSLNGQKFKGMSFLKVADGSFIIEDGTDVDVTCHDICFLQIESDKDSIKIECHNEHNGFYGGFSICFG